MFSSVPERVQLHIAMVIFQIGYAGNHIILRIALNVGISKLVFLIYRITIGLLLLSPFAYFLEKKDRPALNASFVLQFFFLGLVGVVFNNGSYFIGLENTSPVFASTIENSVPAITFALAAIFRIEEVNLRRKDGLAKVFGTFACVAGALIITIYRGPIIYRPDSVSLQSESMILQEDYEGKNWTLGCVSLVVHCICWASWIVLQAPVVKNYPARLSIACYTFLFGLMQFLAIAAFTERDIQAWKIHSQSEFLCVLYAGVVASGLAFSIQIWVVERGGPMLVAAYLPLQTLVAAVMASVFLREAFSLGSILGAVLIISGLYLVVWGKNKENNIKSETEPLKSRLEKNCLPDHEKSFLVEPLMLMEQSEDPEHGLMMGYSSPQPFQIDPERSRFPCCIVWTPIPVLSWFIPFIGHMGLCREDGVILDFAGPYFVCVDNFTFGAVARYIRIDEGKCCVSPKTGEKEYKQDERGTDALTMTWDNALKKGTQEYQHLSYNILTCNCHSFVANNLNRLRFRNGGWNVVNLAAMIFLKGQWVNKVAMVRSLLPFVVVFGIGLYYGGATFLTIWAFFTFLLVGWFLLGTYCFSNLIHL